MSRPSATPVIAIDLVRFLCALLVVTFHVNVAYWLSPSPHGALILPRGMHDDAGTIVTRVGWIGVELFFVISGIVIAHSAIDSGWRDFLRRRILRLAPAAWICASATFAALTFTSALSLDLSLSWLRSLLFWPIGDQIDMSYWTLGVETFFYLAVAAIIGARGSIRSVERLGFAIGAMSGATWMLAFVAPLLLGRIVANQAATLLQIPFGIFFAIGIFIATNGNRPLGAAKIGYAVFLSAAAMIEINLHANGRAADTGLPTSSAMAIGLFFIGVAILAAAPALQTPLSRWISPARARTIGLMTYPLYLIHQDVGAVLIVRLLAAGVPFVLAQIATVTAMIALAWAIARWPEPWLRARLAAAFARLNSRGTPIAIAPSAG